MSAQYQQSSELFLDDECDEDKQVPVDQLSGDEGMDKTVMVTFKNESKANLFETAITVIKTTVGSGVIGVPYTVSVMGWLVSLVMFLIVAVGNQYTVYILIKIKNLAKHSTYNSIAYSIYKAKSFRLLLSFINLFGNVGFIIAMLSIFKSTTHKILLDFIENTEARESFFISETFIAIISGLCLYPTFIVKRVQKLRYTAIVGVLGIFAAIIFTIIIFFDEMSSRNWQNKFKMNAFPTSITATISVIPNIMFALVFQANFFSIYKGLKKATDKRINIATSLAIGFCVTLYLTLGMMGYCLFRSEEKYVNANFLLLLPKEKINTFFYIGIYAGFLICDFFCIPPTFLVARNNLIAIFKIFTLKQESSKRIKTEFQNTIEEIGSFMQAETKEEKDRKATIWFYVLTTLLFIVFIVITIAVQSLEALFNIVGAIASSSISFILPFLFYCLLVRKKHKPKKLRYFICLIGLIISIPLGILAIVSLYI